VLTRCPPFFSGVLAYEVSSHRRRTRATLPANRRKELTRSYSSAVLTSVLILTNVVRAESSLISTEGRDPGVARWISYEVVGPKDSPTTIIYFSTQRFRTYPPEGLFLLSQRRYGILSSYTQQRLAARDCPRQVRDPDGWNTVKVTRHEKSTAWCFLRQDLACAYLADVVHLHGMHWSREELEPIQTFMTEVRCAFDMKH
jgi:hypothetical protein